MGFITGKIISTVIKQVGKTTAKTAGKIMVTNAIINKVSGKNKENKELNPSMDANPSKRYEATKHNDEFDEFDEFEDEIEQFENEIAEINNPNTKRADLIIVPKLNVFKKLYYLDTFNSIKDAGFENIAFVIKRDLTSSKQRHNGLTTSVSIKGQTSFEDRAKVSKYYPVLITYRTFEKGEGIPLLPPCYVSDSVTFAEVTSNKKNELIIAPDISEFKKLYYLDAINGLLMLGFTNIKYKIKRTLKEDKYYKNGLIKSISINGKTSFNEGEKVSQSAPVIITYLTYDDGEGQPLLPPEEIVNNQQ